MHSYTKKKRLNFSYVIILIITFFCFSNPVHAAFQEDVKKDLQLKIKKYSETPTLKKDSTYINLLYRLGLQYTNYNLDSLLIISNETIKLSEFQNYKKGIIQGYLIEGLYYSNVGKQDRATSYFLKALAKAHEINSIDLILDSKNKLAVEYRFREDYAKALKQYLEAIDIAKNNNENKWLTKFYVNVAVIYSSQNEYKQSIVFLKKAMEVNETNRNHILSAKILSNLAESYLKIGDLKNATTAIHKALLVFEKEKLDSWISFSYEIKSSILLEEGQYNDALAWLKKAEIIHANIDKSRYKIPLYTKIAQTYYKLNDYDLAEEYALKALIISDEFNIPEERDLTLDILYKTAKANNKLEQALCYLEDLKSTSDTINKNNNEKELRILKSNLAFEQEKEQYILANEQKQLLQRSYMYFSVLIIMACGIIIIILKKNNKTQNELNLQLIENTVAIKKKEEHLQEANNTKSKLFSIIAHDLKGPINSFKSLFELFNKSELTTSEFMHFMPQIGENIDSIAFTLNNLLTWGQNQMNGLTTKPSSTSIKDLVDDSFKLLSKQAEAKFITTINNVDESVIAWCDKNQIDIVIRNLISNAVKFTREHGEITVNALNQSEYWEIQVLDNGVGINQEALKNIFDTQKTSTSYGTQNEKGTGLGLRICKEMVENNGGNIWVESIINKGSTFYLTIPKDVNS